MTVVSYPNLEYLCKGWFLPDWDADASSGDGVLALYVAQNGDDVLDLTRNEAARLLADAPDEDAIERVLDELECNYDPRNEGMTHREFVEKIARLGLPAV